MRKRRQQREGVEPKREPCEPAARGHASEAKRGSRVASRELEAGTARSAIEAGTRRPRPLAADAQRVYSLMRFREAAR